MQQHNFNLSEKVFFIRCFILLEFFFAYTTDIFAGDDKNMKHILVIQSYKNNDTWADELNKGIEKCLKKNNIKAYIETYYLDARLLKANEELQVLNTLCEKYSKRPIDLIIVFDDEATYSLLKTEHPITYSVPIVFSGVDYPSQELLHTHKNVTGIIDKQNFTQLFDLIAKIYPNRKTIYYLTDQTILGRLSYNQFKKEWQEWAKSHPGYKYLKVDENNMPSKAFLWRLSRPGQTDHCVAITAKWSEFFPGYSRLATTPFFGMNDEGMNNGLTCAFIQGAYKQAWNATQMGVDILKGKPVNEIPITNSIQRPAFDWHQLQRWAIQQNKLPANRIILNQPFYNKYETLIIITGICLAGCIIFLIFHLSRLYKKEMRGRVHAQAKLLIQEDLIKQRHEYNRIFESIDKGMISLDNSMRIVAINSAAINYLKLDKVNREQYIGEDINKYFTIVSLDTGNRLKELISEATSRKQNINLNGMFVEDKNIGDGEYFPISGTISLILENKTCIGTVIAFKNISDEQSLKEYYTLALESGNIFPWEFNANKHQFSYKLDFFHHLGWTDSKERPLSKEEFLNMLHPDDREKARNDLEEITRDNKKRFYSQLRIINSQNIYEWWEFRSSSISGLDDKKAYKILGTCINIQTFKQIEEELRKSIIKAQEADRLKSAFLANISHEIRTPLNAIIGFSSILTSDIEVEETEKKLFLDTINTNCQLLLKLVNDVIDISRIESGEEPFNNIPYDLNLLISDVYASHMKDNSDKLKLILDIPDRETIINIDPDRITQLMNNLLNNAFKFTQEGCITIGYTIEEGKQINLFVKDTGKGIDACYMNKIFERFYKVDEFIQGAGLGLSICKVIINKYNGNIGVESKAGYGSTFTVSLPFTAVNYKNASKE